MCSAMSNSLQPHGLQPARLLCLWDPLGKNAGVGCHCLLQGIFPTQGSNPHLLCLLHWQAGSLPLCHVGSRIGDHCPLHVWERWGGRPKPSQGPPQRHMRTWAWGIKGSRLETVLLGHTSLASLSSGAPPPLPSLMTSLPTSVPYSAPPPGTCPSQELKGGCKTGRPHLVPELQLWTGPHPALAL